LTDRIEICSEKVFYYNALSMFGSIKLA
jgi:hypothetical protein